MLASSTDSCKNRPAISAEEYALKVFIHFRHDGPQLVLTDVQFPQQDPGALASSSGPTFTAAAEDRAARTEKPAAHAPAQLGFRENLSRRLALLDCERRRLQADRDKDRHRNDDQPKNHTSAPKAMQVRPALGSRIELLHPVWRGIRKLGVVSSVDEAETTRFSNDVFESRTPQIQLLRLCVVPRDANATRHNENNEADQES
jgi:hypothetical protein